MQNGDYANACEMKRLYIHATFRCFGLSWQVVDELLDGAKSLGYSCVLLDILEEMDSARWLYDSLGFEEFILYYFNPLPAVHYLKYDFE